VNLVSVFTAAIAAGVAGLWLLGDALVCTAGAAAILYVLAGWLLLASVTLWLLRRGRTC
jgi:hypothetical protein